jgi:ABC-2 type transport system permease protein
VNVILAIIPPVFYSIDRLPVEAQYLSYLVPTTHASLILQYTMGMETPREWSLTLALLVLFSYMIGFLILAKFKALWREN